MGLEFLDPLEDRVREASERLRELARDNADLRRRVEELERELDAAELEDEKHWHREREEVRRRVGALVDRLAALSAAATAADDAPR
ncbi:MAG: cell division protein ZapB [Thermoanaerobaculia bacterium]